MDPQHRWLLECAYHALENAGVPLEAIAESKTGVFCGSFTDDYRISMYKDVAAMPKHAAIGVGQNFTANRLSWAFNLKGPSLQIDTACSSSLVALDVACQSLRTGDSDMVSIIPSNNHPPDAHVTDINSRHWWAVATSLAADRKSVV